MKKLLIGALMAAVAAPVSAETMTNDTVVSLVREGLGDDLVIAKISSEPCGYDIATPTLIALKNEGISEKILAAMVSRCASMKAARGIAGDDSSVDPMVRHSPGIYVLENWGTPTKLQLLDPAQSSGMKTSGNGSIIFPLVAKLILRGETSSRPVPGSNPKFYFYFNPNDIAVSDFGQEHSDAAQSPDAFSLVSLKPKKGNRELEMGRASAYAGSLVSLRKGLSLKSSVPFQATKKGDGIYEVTTGTLEPGEYAFVFTGGDQSARVYDFTIARQGGSRN